MANLDRIRETVAATRADQGLPATVADPLIVGTVAEMLRQVASPERDLERAS